MSNKSKYRQFSKSNPALPIFSKDWWLDATCGADGWDVALVERGGEIVASLPYAMTRSGLFVKIGQPMLTQKLGPWLKPIEGKQATVLSEQKELMSGLLEGLPNYDQFLQNFDHGISNWLPFYWQGFKQTTRYTYVISSLADTGKLYSDLQSNIRREIKKAKDRNGITVVQSNSIDDYLAINRQTFGRQGLKVPYSDDYVRNLDAACSKNGCRKIWLAKDTEGRVHAGAYIVWDSDAAYYLMGGGDPELRTSGAMSLCLWEAILDASKYTKSFDFEGSMIEPIERFVRAFGATQRPYFQISRTPSRLIRMKEALRMVLTR